MARPRSRTPTPGEDFLMSVALDGEVAQQVLDLAESQGVHASRVLRELVSRGLEVGTGARLNHRVLQQREALREVRTQVLGEVRGAVAEALNSRWSGRSGERTGREGTGRSTPSPRRKPRRG